MVEVLLETRHPFSLITKNALVERDLDLLAPLAAMDLVQVHFSVTTLDNRLSSRLEPRAAAPHARLRAMKTLADAGTPFKNYGLAKLCQTCQLPCVFTEPDDPTKICYRESEYQGEKYHTCSDGCKHIFDDEPEKYIQSWLPVHQIYQGNCFPEGTDPTVEGFNPLAKVLEYYHFDMGHDNLDFEGSRDQANFAAWRGMATKNT